MLFSSPKGTPALSMIAIILFGAALAGFAFVLSAEVASSQSGDDHGNTFQDATPIALGDSIAGNFDSSDPWDVFRLDLSGQQGITDVWLYTSGDLDTLGILYDADQNRIAYSTQGFVGQGQEILNFHLRWDLPAGVYYVRVLSEEGVTGNYTLHASSVPVSSAISTGTAVSLTVDSTVAGTLRSASDAHYYRLNVTGPLSLRILAQGVLLFDDNGILAEPAIVEILDSRGNEITVNTFGRVLRSSIFGTFLFGNVVVDDFSPGTYFIRVISPEGSEQFQDFQASYPVPYTLLLSEDLVYPAWIDSCKTATDSLGNSDIEDPLFGCQWHLNNLELGGQDINVEEVWSEGHMGQGVNVVIVDSSIDYSHEDLIDNVDRTKLHDYGGMNGAYRPYEHHGTNVSGVIAGRDNQSGVRGVAPRATIYGHNLLTLDEIEDANRADAMSRSREKTAVSNNSWGPTDGPGITSFAASFWEAAVESGVREGFDGKGTFYAWAAGNGGDEGDDSNLDELANFYAVTAVCAVGDEDIRVVYSEVGANLWVCAPSLDLPPEESRGIVTTENSDRYYRNFNGTSASAPIVSGVAALLREVNPELTWRDLKLILAASARKNDSGNSGWEDGSPMYGSESSADRYHFNYEYGFGMVDAGTAVGLAKEWTNVPPRLMSEAASNSNLGRRVPDASDSGTGAAITERLTLNTPVGFVEYVELEVDLAHESFRDIEIELESPSGRVSRILAPFDTRQLEEFIPLDGKIRFGSAKHLGEDPNGEWTLRVRDHFGEKDGTLRAWSIKVYGHGADCWQRISGDQVVSGDWDESQCESVDRQGNASRYYSFTVAQESLVTVKLESDVDPYLYLRAGEARSGTFVEENDDHEGSQRVSQISETLAAGSYTIEATTFNAGATGTFTLTVSGLGTGATTPPVTDGETSDPCGEELSGDGDTSGQWSSDCTSEVRSGNYAKYYSFTVAQESLVTVKLESDVDPYLYLRAGEARSGTFVEENDDHEGSQRVSQISETLAAGSYTIEATTFNAGATGTFTLTVSGLGTGATTPPVTDGETSDPCGEELSGDGDTSGQWSSDCTSEVRSGNYAKYYSFTVAQESLVTVKLESDVDPYLYLRAGEARSGTFVEENDDHEGSQRVSQISETLAAGSYTIEATTFNAGATGTFTLTVSGLGTGATTPPVTDGETSDPCGEELSGDGDTSGQWSSDCTSEVRSGNYAKYYSFTVAQESLVTVKLESDVDPYLYLRAGEARSGTFVEENDDHEGSQRVSQISETLAAGSYTIEATTFNAGATGTFTLTVSGLGTGATTPPVTDGETSDPCGEELSGDGDTSGQWSSDCTSEVRSGNYAKYYSFTVAQESLVTVKLESDVDPYLYLRAGEARSGTFVEENDDHEGSQRVSQISETLAAGSYTIEATTFNAGATGTFTLTVSGLGTGATTPPVTDGETSDPCGEELSGDGDTSGQWSSDCTSEVRSGNYAKYYSFTVAQESLVTVKLESDVDPYLYLRAGEARSGTFVEENDDHEGSQRVSQISETLAAGSYTIEATTFNAGATGTFTLTVSGLGTGATTPPVTDGETSDPCGEELSGDGDTSGQWSSDCTSEVRSGNTSTRSTTASRLPRSPWLRSSWSRM